MSHILTVIIDVDAEGGMAVKWFESDGTTDEMALAAVQALERALQQRIVRAELEAERAAQEEESP